MADITERLHKASTQLAKGPVDGETSLGISELLIEARQNIAKLRSQLEPEVFVDERDRLREERDEYRAMWSEAYNERETAIAERDGMKKRLDDAESEVRKLRPMVMRDVDGHVITQGALNALMSQRNTAWTEAESLRIQNEQLVDQLKDLKDTVKDYKNSYAGLKRSRDYWEKKAHGKEPFGFIIVRTGYFADGSGPSFRVFKPVRDFNHEWWEFVEHVENDPTTLSKARERLADLMDVEGAS